MKIQLITNNQLEKEQWSSIDISPLSNPYAIDEYDVNVIDLSYEYLWVNSKNRTTVTIDDINDFNSIRMMVEKKRKAKIVYVFPQNTTYRYRVAKEKEIPLKDYLKEAILIIKSILPQFLVLPNIIYENSNTELRDVRYHASFYFDELNHAVTKSISEKTTTIVREKDVFITTLEVLKEEKNLIDFLDYLFDDKECYNKPEWINEVYFYDDIELEEEMTEYSNQIIELQNKITDLKERQDENSKAKSILYTSGDLLVERVLNILEKLLEYDLSGFKDVKKEDFLIKKDGYTLIGEIKGVNSNVKYQHISQVEVHKSNYLDQIASEDDQKKVHQILIVCPFRATPVHERAPINEQQIKLAERNGCLIVTTDILLKLYEKYLQGKVNTIICERLFIENSGVLSQEMIDRL